MADSIHIVEVEARNFHRLSVAQVEHVPGKGLVRISGKNGAGKTSLLRAIMAALGGAGSIEDSVISEGADKGEVRVKLSNGYQIVRRFTEASPKGYLTILGPDGGSHKQAKLNEWVGPRAFDPLSFFSLSPAKQRDVLLSIGTDAKLGAKIDELRARYKVVYDDRTPWISAERRYRATKPPAGERPVEVDVSDLMLRLSSLHDQERACQKADQAVKGAQGLVERAETECALHRGKIQAFQDQLDRELEHLAKAEDLVRGREEDVARLARDAQELADPADDIQEVKAQLAEVDGVRSQLGPWEDYDRAQLALTEATKEVGARTKKLDTMQAKERKLLADAGLPVEGLTFDAETGDPLLNERPLSVASGREQIDLAVAVAFAANPALRICLLDEANGLDLEALDALSILAVDHDFQVWAVRLGLEGPGDIVVEDGVASESGE